MKIRKESGNIVSGWYGGTFITDYPKLYAGTRIQNNPLMRNGRHSAAIEPIVGLTCPTIVEP